MPTVTVACKLPNGLQLELKGHPPVKLNGTAVHYGTPPVAVNGVALTHNVDADFWARWSKEYKNYTPVRLGLIFAGANDSDVIAQAAELRDVKTGLEPLDQDNPGQGLEKVGPGSL
jgi:hypothetical protein